MVANFIYVTLWWGRSTTKKLDAERLRYAHHLAGNHMRRSNQWVFHVMRAAHCGTQPRI